MQKDYRREISDFCAGLGLSLFGVADITVCRRDFCLSAETAARFERAVSIGARLSDAVIEDIADFPTRLYFHHYKTVNAFLDQCAYRIFSWIQQKGFQALPVPASQIIDWQNHTALLSHKEIGRLAGLGWIGRNNLLVNPRLGSRFRLATVLTDLPLKPDKPLPEDCGGCRECVKACPAQAIKERPGDFDHQGCFGKLKEFQRKRYAEQFVCGICLKACRGSKI